MAANLQTPQTACSKLREFLNDYSEMVVCPGVYDGFTARLALNTGFKALYMVPPASAFTLCPTLNLQTGAGTTMSRLGQADLGLATLNDMVSNASMIASLDPSVPLIADADTG